MFSKTIAILLSCVAASCSTPPQILEQSSAATDLYARVDETFLTWRDALRSELLRRERVAQQIQLRLGEAELDLEPDQGDGLDLWLESALRSFRGEIEWLRIAHGIVDRFLRIEVVDLDEVQAVTESVRQAFEAPTGGGS